MSKASCLLKLIASIKATAARLTMDDGVSPNQWVARAAAKKIGVVEPASDSLKRWASSAQSFDILTFSYQAMHEVPPVGDEI